MKNSSGELTITVVVVVVVVVDVVAVVVAFDIVVETNHQAMWLWKNKISQSHSSPPSTSHGLVVDFLSGSLPALQSFNHNHDNNGKFPGGFSICLKFFTHFFVLAMTFTATTSTTTTTRTTAMTGMTTTLLSTPTLPTDRNGDGRNSSSSSRG
jgi:hypothetical protein